MSRKDDIAALLTRAEEQLDKIVDEYNSSLAEKAIAASLKVDIKNFCENLRSVLDYLAHDIRSKYCPSANPRNRFYFPILPDAVQFASKMASWYPGLQTGAAAVYAELERCQPYQTGFAWLGQLNKVNNENKHGALVAQNREELGSRIKAEIKEGGSVSWDPSAVKFGSGVFIGGVPVDPTTQMPAPNPRLEVTKTTWVDFRFDGLGVSAIALLKDSLAGIKQIDKSLAPHL